MAALTAARQLPRECGEVRWGIIGCGDVTEKKSGPALSAAKNSRLVAVMRRDGAKAADYARRHGVPRWYDRVDALLADGEVNCVYVATPPGSHLQIALAVAAAGLPCYVEKPQGRTAAECDAMAAAFEARKLPLYVAYYRRAYPRYTSLRDSVRNGRFGDIARVTYVFARPAPPPGGWRVAVEHSGGGHFLDVGSHALDLLDYVLGAPIQLVASAAYGPPGGAETVVELSFTIGPATGSARWDFDAESDADRLEIVGSEMSAVCPSCLNGRDVLYYRHGANVLSESHPPPAPVQGPLVASVVDDLLGRGECDSTPASSARCPRPEPEKGGPRV